jgi:hypothetical protein
MVASVIKVVQTRIFAHPDDDPTVATVSYDRWLFIEAYLVIITASIPCVRSLLRPFEGRSTGTGRSAYELSSPYAGTSLPNSRRMTPTTPAKVMMRISDGNDSTDDILDWSNHDTGELHEPTVSSKSVHSYV